MRDFPADRQHPTKPNHRYAWLWEPLEADATFLLRAMFGAKAAYLDGKLYLCFMAKTEPWRGVLVCTERAHHASLIRDFPVLSPHSVLAKWLYLPESSDDFERDATQLVRLALRRDPRLGVTGSARRSPPPRAIAPRDPRLRAILPACTSALPPPARNLPTP